MKEQITKFDLEAAFKALDEIEVPHVKGLRANRLDLSEATKRVDKTSLLVEEYYDLQDKNDLQEASDERDAEVAQAKLARIEKIVDLNAKTPEELLPSYAGKAIIQCPQCMNIFFKEQSDIVGPDGDIKSVVIGDTVNKGEICQHCGNDSGYIFSGWVEAEAPEANEDSTAEETTEVDTEVEEIPEEETTVEELPEEDSVEESTEESEEADLEEIPDEEIPEEEGQEEEEEKKEESFIQPTGEALNESTTDLDKKLEEHNEYIEVLQAEIKKEEEAIKEAKNDFIKKMHEENLESLKAALDQAIPEEVKSEIDDLPDADEVPEEVVEGEDIEETTESLEESTDNIVAFIDETGSLAGEKADQLEEKAKADKITTIKRYTNENKVLDFARQNKDTKIILYTANDDFTVNNKDVPENIEVNQIELPEIAESLNESCEGAECTEANCEVNPVITHTDDEVQELNEEEQLPELTDTNIDKMLASDEFKKPVSESEAESCLADGTAAEEKEDEFAKVENLHEASFNKHMSKYFTEVYSNAEKFEATSCEFNDNKLIIEGIITFKSGKTKPTKFDFELKNGLFEGLNKDISTDKAFKLNYFIEDGGTTLMTENLQYNYVINNAVVEGNTK